MRTITTTVTVYAFDELSTEAQEKAVATIRELLDGDWWDGSDSDDIGNVMMYELAETFKTPGWDTYGVADFPGINGFKIAEWDLGRSQRITASGTLTRENAPALPWVDGIDTVELGAHRDYTQINAVDAEPECDCGVDIYTDCLNTCASLTSPGVTDDQRNPIEQAIRDALSAAWSAGEKEMEYKTGDENAKQVAESHEFNEDGSLYV